MTIRHRALTAGVLIPAGIFLALFFVIPLILVGVTIARIGGPAAFSAGTVISPSYFVKITSFTFYQAFMSTILAVVLGLPGGYILGRRSFPGKRLVQSLTAIPFMLPSIIIVLGFVILYGNNGTVNRLLGALFDTDRPPLPVLYTKYAIILAHGFYNFPLTVRYVSAYVANLPKNQEQAASLLGAGPLRIFFTVTLPRTLPAVLSAASLIFIFCFLSFALILVLGGGPKTTTIEVEVYRLARIHVDLRNAAVLGTASTAFALLVTYVYARLQNMMQRPEISATSGTAVPVKSGSGKVFTAVYLGIIILFSLGPLAAVFVKSLMAQSGYRAGSVFGIGAWTSLFTGNSGQRVFLSIFNSLGIAAASSVIALTVAFLLAYGIHHSGIRKTSGMETLLMMPIGISSILLSLGYLGAKTYFNIPREASAFLIILAHAVITYPFVLRSILSSYRKIPVSILHSASVLGAGPLRRFRTIEFPLLKKALIAAAAFSFAISMGEINASLMLSEGTFLTMPIAIYRLIGSYNFAGACALGTLLIASGLAAFFLIDSLGGHDGT